MITQDITIRGLTPAQIQQLQEFVQRELMVNPSRPDDVVRTAGELVHTPPLAPVPASLPAAPAAAPLSAPAVVSAPATLPAGDVAAPGAAPAVAVDSRGVPWHQDHHAALSSKNNGLNADGTWKRKRGHHVAAADAYEARFTSSRPTSAPAPATVPPVTSTVDPAPSVIVPLTPPPLPGAAVEPVRFPYPGEPVTADQMTALWSTLVTAQKVGSDHANYMRAAFGSHPVEMEFYAANPDRLTAAYNWLWQYNI